MPFRIFGLRKLIKMYSKYPEAVEDYAVKEMRVAERDMPKTAKNDHRFKSGGKDANGRSRTGNAERSIEAKVDRKKLNLTFQINPDRVTVRNKGRHPRYNYAWGLNDGTRNGYKRGKISPRSSRAGGRGGIRHDDFMGRSWKKHEPALFKRLKKAPSIILRKLSASTRD